MDQTYTAPNTIQLSGDFTREEYLASAALTPGHLIEFISTGKVQKHATAKGFHARMFAVEDALQGRRISDAYAADELVQCNLVKPGSIVRAWLKAGQNIVKGDKLVSAGDGTLQKVSSSDLQLVGIAQEALDLSASGTSATRLTVQVV